MDFAGNVIYDKITKGFIVDESKNLSREEFEFISSGIEKPIYKIIPKLSGTVIIGGSVVPENVTSVYEDTVTIKVYENNNLVHSQSGRVAYGTSFSFLTNAVNINAYTEYTVSIITSRQSDYRFHGLVYIKGRIEPIKSQYIITKGV